MRQFALILVCLARISCFGQDAGGGVEKPAGKAPVLSTAELRSMVSSNAMAILDDKQKFAIGDKVTIRILEDRDEPLFRLVLDPGDLDFPYLGRVAVLGKTCKEAAFEIKAQLEKTHYFRATVLLTLESASRSRGKIQIIGQVRAQGTMDLPPDETMTVSKVILRAGGFADFAKKTHVKLIRKTGPGENDKEEFIINVDEIWTKQKTEKDMTVQPDDLIFVPQKLVNF